MKADASGDALDHARKACGIHAGFLAGNHEQRRAQRHEHVGAQARGPARALTFIADDAAEKRRRQQAHDDVRELLGCRQPGWR